MKYILYIIMFLAITLKWFVLSSIQFIWEFKIPINCIKKDYTELYNIIKE